jgi:hypothetical protein
MVAARTPGITIGVDGRRFIDKRYHGTRIGMRVGGITQEQAEKRLQTERQQVDLELARRAYARPLFRDWGARHLAQCRDKRSLKPFESTCDGCCRTSATWSRSRCTTARSHPSSLSARPSGRVRQLGSGSYHHESRRALVPRRRRSPLARGVATVDHHVVRIAASALSDCLGRTGPPVPETTGASAADYRRAASSEQIKLVAYWSGVSASRPPGQPLQALGRVPTRRCAC